MLVGLTDSPLPVPARAPPQEAVYHLIVSPVPPPPPLSVNVVLPPLHIGFTLADAEVGSADFRLVVKAAVLVLTVLVQVGVAVKAMAVILTTLAAPAVFRAEVVKVPVPGEPEVKLIVAVVLPTVLVPLTL